MAEEDVTVPAGTFTCYKHQIWGLKTGQLYQEYWASPRVGLVKLVLYGLDGVETRELSSYTPGS